MLHNTRHLALDIIRLMNWVTYSTLHWDIHSHKYSGFGHHSKKCDHPPLQ